MSMNEVDWMILRALSLGPKTQTQLAAHTSMSRESVRRAVVRLKEKGQIFGVGGVYQLSHLPVAA